MGRKTLLVAYLSIIIGVAALQLMLGASLFLLIVMAMVGASGSVAILRQRLTVGDALYFLLAQYYGTAALVIKTLLGQPVQANLIEPDLSAAVLFVGYASMTLGYLMANSYSKPLASMHRVIRTFDTREFCQLVAVPTFALGAVLTILHNTLRAQVVEGQVDAGGFGGLGSFLFILPLGWACQARLALGKEARSFDFPVLVAMGVLSLGIALFANVKVIFFQYCLVVALAYVAFGVRVRARTLVAAGLSIGLLMLYVQPIIQITRAAGADLGAVGRFKLILPTLIDAGFDPGELQERSDTVARGYTLSYAGSYVYPSTWNVDRYAMIQPIDQVSRGLDKFGTMGGIEIFQEVVETTLPSFLVSKTGAATADMIGWHFGFTKQGGIARPVVGLVASSLAAFGMIGVIILPGLMTFLSIYTIHLFGKEFWRSPWAIFVFMSMVPIVEKEIGPIILLFTRQAPIQAAVIAIIYFVGLRWMPPAHDRWETTDRYA